MRKLIAVTLLISTFFSIGSLAFAGDPLNRPFKTLYASPTKESNKVFEIPIEVRLLDISDDGDWYKVRISYSVGPFNFSHTGWIQIPFAEILAEKRESEIASIIK